LSLGERLRAGKPALNAGVGKTWPATGGDPVDGRNTA
jgi:hypothetical protein